MFLRKGYWLSEVLQVNINLAEIPSVQLVQLWVRKIHRLSNGGKKMISENVRREILQSTQFPVRHCPQPQMCLENVIYAMVDEQRRPSGCGSLAMALRKMSCTEALLQFGSAAGTTGTAVTAFQ